MVEIDFAVRFTRLELLLLFRELQGRRGPEEAAGRSAAQLHRLLACPVILLATEIATGFADHRPVVPGIAVAVLTESRHL